MTQANKSPAFQFYPRDWLGDPEIMLMDWDAKGMHLHLICIAWTRDVACTIPNDDEVLMRWLHITDKQDWLNRLKPQIMEAWKKEDGLWVQSRLKREKTKQLQHSEKRQAAANKRWEKHQKNNNSNASASASAKQVECPSSSTSTSSSNNKSEKKFNKNDLSIAERILGLIRLMNPGHKQPSIDKWADTIRLMREQDGRTHQEIIDLFTWANKDDFWKANILSPEKLRKQWDKLLIKKKSSNGELKPAWAKIPFNDDELMDWAKTHGYPKPGQQSYPQYRRTLQNAVQNRLDQQDAAAKEENHDSSNSIEIR